MLNNQIDTDLTSDAATVSKSSILITKTATNSTTTVKTKLLTDSNSQSDNESDDESVKSNDSTSTNNSNFQLSEPFKLKNFKYNQNINTILLQAFQFEFIEPVKLNIKQKNISNFDIIKNNTFNQQQQQPVRNHVILVEQAPFSVLKSVKSQEHVDEDKPDKNVIIINSIRNHPYNNSIRPIDLNKPHSTQTIFLNNSKQLEQRPVTTLTNILPSPTTKTDSNLPITQTTSENTTTMLTETQSTYQQKKIKKLNRNSSSNAILAQIKSLGPNFKSIFVRPKNSKHIESSHILNKIKPSTADKSTAQSSIFSSLFKTKTDENLFVKILPYIEPKELKLNQSVDDILNRYAVENDVLSKTIKNISNLSSSSPARSNISTPGTMSPIGISGSDLSSFKTRIYNNTKIKQEDLQQQVEKWTCMVCLSKHANKVDICSICGSSKPATDSIKSANTISFTKPSTSTYESDLKRKQQFSTYLMHELGFDREQGEKFSELDLLNKKYQITNSTSSSSASSKLASNPYLKKWTCIHCNYSNDSLKIVCLNCRWVKTNTTNAKQAQKLNESIKSPSKATLDLLEKKKQREEQEEEEKSRRNESESPAKKSKPTEATRESICSSCKSPIREEQKEEEKTIKKTEVGFFVSKQSTNKNWSCDTCLVSNPDTTEKCLCCSTPKSGSKQANKTTETPLTTTTTTSSLSSLFNAASKWDCSTCLASNPNSSDKCLCCSTPKPGPKPIETTPQISSNTSSTASPLSLQSLFQSKPQTSSKWECKTCLVSNDSDKSKCVCCQSDKPGSTSGSTASTANTLPLKPFSLGSQPTLILPENTTKTIPNTNIKFGLSSADSSTKITFGSTSNILKVNQENGEKPDSTIKMSFSSSFGQQPISTQATTSLFKLPSVQDKQEEAKKPEEKKDTNEPFKSLSGFNLGFNKPLESQVEPLKDLSKPSTVSPFKFDSSSFTQTPSTTTNTTPAVPATTTASFVASPLSGLSTTAQNTPSTSTTLFSKPIETAAATTKIQNTPITTNSLSQFSKPIDAMTTSTTTTQNTPSTSTTLAPFSKPLETTATSSGFTSTPFKIDQSASSLFPTPPLTQSSSLTGLNSTQIKPFSLFSATTSTTPSTSATPSPAKPQESSTKLPAFGSTFNTPTSSSGQLPTSNSSTSFFQLTQTPAQSTTTADKTGFFSKPTETPSIFGNTMSSTSLFSASSTATNKPLFGLQDQSKNTTNLSFGPTSNTPSSSFFKTSTSSNGQVTTPFQFGEQNNKPAEQPSFQTPTSGFSQFSAFGNSNLSNTTTPQTTNTSLFFGTGLKTSPSSSLTTPPQTAAPQPFVFGSATQNFGSTSSSMPNNTTASTGFNFNLNPNFNFTGSAQNLGIIQFSGNNDQSGTSDTANRRYRKAVRKKQ